MSAERCESCDAAAGRDVRVTTVSVDGVTYRVCTRCAEVAVPMHLPFQREERS